MSSRHHIKTKWPIVFEMEFRGLQARVIFTSWDESGVVFRDPLCKRESLHVKTRPHRTPPITLANAIKLCLKAYHEGCGEYKGA